MCISIVSNGKQISFDDAISLAWQLNSMWPTVLAINQMANGKPNQLTDSSRKWAHITNPLAIETSQYN